MSDNLLERVQILCHAHIICVNSRPKSAFKDQEAVKCLSSLHDKYVIVPADKASNDIVLYVNHITSNVNQGIRHK